MIICYSMSASGDLEARFWEVARKRVRPNASARLATDHVLESCVSPRGPAYNSRLELQKLIYTCMIFHSPMEKTPAITNHKGIYLRRYGGHVVELTFHQVNVADRASQEVDIAGCWSFLQFPVVC